MNFQTCNVRVFACFIAASFFLLASCTTKTTAQKASSTTPVQPKITIVAPVYTELKQNSLLYNGTAVSAEYFDRTHPGIITKPVMNGMLTNGETFSVSSEKGFYDESNHKVTLADNIHAVLNNTYTLTCDSIDYFIEKKLIISQDPITVYSKDLQLHGDKGSINLEKNIMTVQGNINAKIYNMSLK
ncbi:MAG: LPS export ABC transporter periplasmic protein LptC [Deltaproteobacteria bacterium]|nr:LPS export ABC transporter periplasmic protein LptC [Deltaproteobacteria bacterium]